MYCGAGLDDTADDRDCGAFVSVHADHADTVGYACLTNWLPQPAGNYSLRTSESLESRVAAVW